MSTPGIQSKKGFPFIKAGLAAGAAALGIFALSQMGDHDGEQQSEKTELKASFPFDPEKPHYVTAVDSQIRLNTAGEPVRNVWLKAGSCIEAVVDSSGKPVTENLHVKVKMDWDSGNAPREAFIHMGNVGELPKEAVTQGFVCKAMFMEKASGDTAAPVMPAPLTMVATETINLRSKPDREAEIWGVLAKDSCVIFTGDEQGGMKQVGIARNGGETADEFKWVVADQVQSAPQSAASCRANWTIGGAAGTTLNPNAP